MCQFLSKFVLETKFVPLFSTGPTVFNRLNLQYGGKTRAGCDWQSQFISHKTNLDHTCNKCIKIQIKNIDLFILDIYLPGRNVSMLLVYIAFSFLTVWLMTTTYHK